MSSARMTSGASAASGATALERATLPLLLLRRAPALAHHHELAFGQPGHHLGLLAVGDADQDRGSDDRAILELVDVHLAEAGAAGGGGVRALAARVVRRLGATDGGARELRGVGLL